MRRLPLLLDFLGLLGDDARQPIHIALTRIVRSAGSGGELDPVPLLGSVSSSFPEIPASELSESFGFRYTMENCNLSNTS